MLLEVARLIGTIVLHVGSVEANRIKTKLEILTGRRSRRRVSEVAIQLVAAERTLVTTSTTRTPQESTRESCW
jgi:copper chaperone CopZ